MSNSLALQNKSDSVSSAPVSRKPGARQGLLVTLDAKAGKQDQLAGLLNNALSAAAREPGTITWYAYRITETKFGIFDTFFDEDARHAHLNGEIAKLLEQVAEDVLAEPPHIQQLSIVATKLKQ